MKGSIITGIGVLLLGFLSCSKKNTIPTVSGTINGTPAITLYGNSNLAADYIFLSSVTATKEMSYDGNIFTYSYLTTSTNEIYVIRSVNALVKGSLDTIGKQTVFTIDTSYIPTFGSTVYTSR